MYIVTVRIQVLENQVAEFLAATIENATATRSEPGNVRFDVLRRLDAPSCFTLYEVYLEESDFSAHQRTAHYLTWKERVAPMMASPRIGEKHSNVCPEPWQ